MAEVLAVTASIVAVLTITNAVLSVCYNYGAAVKTASLAVADIERELEDLRAVLQSLEPIANKAEFSDTGLIDLDKLCPLLQAELDGLLEKLKTPAWAANFGPKRTKVMQSIIWPLKAVETQKTIETISRHKATLHLALSVGQTSLMLKTQKLSLSTNNTTIETQNDVRLIRDAVLGFPRERIYRWLSAPDPSINHHRACRIRQDGTGLWFLGEKFNKWTNRAHVMWLHGKPGCGKTVLSSAIINQVYQTSRFDGVAIAYFYFDFGDAEKQRSDKMICSLIKQLHLLSRKKSLRLEALFSSCNEGEKEPKLDDLMQVLKDLMQEFPSIYIILDALDECSDQQVLLQNIEEIHTWRVPELHLLLTSRKLPEIKTALMKMTNSRSRVPIPSEAVNIDIELYVRQRLQNDPRLERWRNRIKARNEIEETLKAKADGMFRWAVCQLDALSTCFDMKTLRKALASLPETLDETYARILSNISPAYSDHAIRILQWLAYSRRPLTLGELAEVVAVNTTGNPWFDHDARFPEPRDILTICPGLLVEEIRTDDLEKEIEGDSDDGNDGDGDEGINEADNSAGNKSGSLPKFKHNNIIRLAHFSVKEYLLSERIRDQVVSKFAIEEKSSHRSIAAHCLAYILQFEHYGVVRSDYRDQRFIKGYHLSNYAFTEWIGHVKMLGKDLGFTKELSLRLLITCRETFEKIYFENATQLGGSDFRTPLYYVSEQGAIELVRLLLDNEADAADVNARGEAHNTALQTASELGNVEMVELLLNNEADVNAYGGDFDPALHAASGRGYVEVVQLLLSHAADVNMQAGIHNTALQAASSEGHVKTVELLLHSGADVNVQGGLDHTALQAASKGGHVEIVQMLLHDGADVSPRGGRFHTALHAAAYMGHEEVTKLLLTNNADVSTSGRFAVGGELDQHGTALHAASAVGQIAIVELLLKHGADANAVGIIADSKMTALQMASQMGSDQLWWHTQRPSDESFEEIVQLLQSAQDSQRNAEEAPV